MSLLASNATTTEKNIEKAIDYNVNTDLLSGFKFEDADQWLKFALSYEYSLAQVNIDDFQERVLKGLAFHRIRGTPASLRNALSWYNFHDIIIEEEPPGEHFAEFQIGLSEIPNSFGVGAIVSVAEVASPLRSRLSRMYNSLYDVRRFILDGSKFGDFLSDHSGIRLQNNGPKLSFGRHNAYELQTPEITEKYINKREHFDCAKNIDTYKLDFANLDDAPPDALNRRGASFSMKYIWNEKPIGDRLENLLQAGIIAKALVVLSDSILGNINSNLSAGYEKVTEEPFVISFSLLSQHKSVSERILVEERFFRENLRLAASTFTHSVSEFEYARNYVIFFQNFSCDINKTHTRNHYENIQYHGNDTWHDHSHFCVPWNQQNNHTKISSDQSTL